MNENEMRHEHQAVGKSYPFQGTPWSSDQEIYDYAMGLKQNVGWEWHNVRNSLVSQGLDEQYADAIIANLIAVEPQAGMEDSSLYFDVIDNRGMFRRPFSFEGRIRRTEFCLSYLIYCAYAFAVGFFVGILAALAQSNALMGLVYIFIIPGVWFMWAQGAKRCHDLGHSGWFQLIPFYILWMMFAPGDAMTTGYGTSPKAAY